MLNKDFWRGKKVFLTGHTGFKGSWLSMWLSMLGANVYGYALTPATEPNLFALAKIETIITSSKTGNILAYEELEKEICRISPDIVIHMAAQALVRDSYREPLKTYAENVLGTANVLEAVRQSTSVKAVLVITTDKCYENQEWCWGYRENDNLGGFDPYSSSKACAEIVTAAYRQSFFAKEGISVATARAGNVIGGGDWSKERLLPDCFRAIEKGEKIIVRNPDAIRPWQHVLEPLGGYLMLGEKLYTEGQCWAESWNFGPSEQGTLSVGKLVQKICQKLHAKFEIQQDNIFHEAKYLKLDCSKVNMRLGWKANLAVEDAVLYIAEWFKAYQKNADLQKVSMRQIANYMERI